MQNSINERRDRTRTELMSLIKDRNQMLSQYCLLAGTGNLFSNEQNTENETGLLGEFCENLIDYLARGQFELYQRITDGEERRHDIVTLTNKIYPRIVETTNVAVDFNDAFDKSRQELGNFDHYGERLSQLGEQLAIRFELEDKLIYSLLVPKAEVAVALSA